MLSWPPKRPNALPEHFTVGPVHVELKNRTRRWSADVYHLLLNTTWPRLIGIFFLTYLCTNALFGFLYWIGGSDIQNARPGSYPDSFWFSVQTYATIGYGGMSPATTYAHFLVTLEAFCGMLSTAFGTGILFAKFSRPRARIEFSTKMVVHSHNGRPVLELRLTNQRRGTLSEASMSLSVVMDEITREGLTIRAVHSLKVEQPRAPILFLVWNLRHVLDETSPLAGLSAQNIDARIVGALATLTATDDTTMETVRAREFYAPADVVFDARFVDMVDSRADNAFAVIDCARLNEIESAAETPDIAE